MIAEIIKTLQAGDYYGAGKYTELAKGKHELVTDFKGLKRTLVKDWAWAYPTYSLEIDNGKEILAIEIDGSQTMADVNRENNVFKAQ